MNSILLSTIPNGIQTSSRLFWASSRRAGQVFKGRAGFMADSQIAPVKFWQSSKKSSLIARDSRMADAKDAGLTLYTAGTPNGWKASIVLEELGVKYNVHKITMSKNEQKEDWFLKINPNGRIPAIVDHKNGDFAVFESGAIMLYLCDMYDQEGKFLPKDLKERYEVIQWLMFQMGGVGPMQGQANHFVRYAPEKIAYGQNRYINETKRLYGVIESRLQNTDWLAAGKYTIADMANFSWVSVHFWAGVEVDEFPKLQAWLKRVGERDAVKRGLDVPEPSSFTAAAFDPKLAQKMIQEAQAMMVSTKPT